MSHPRRDRRGLGRLLATGVGALVMASVPLVASAQPDPGHGAPESDPIVWVASCPLTRIGEQLVRCDQLTGAGATAMLWLPEQRPAGTPTTSPNNPLQEMTS